MKKKKSLISFVYTVIWIINALWISLSETINILKKLKEKTTTTTIFWDAPENVNIGYVHSSL